MVGISLAIDLRVRFILNKTLYRALTRWAVQICTLLYIYCTTIKWPIEELSPDSCRKIFIPVVIKAYAEDTVSILFFVVNLSPLLTEGVV